MVSIEPLTGPGTDFSAFTYDRYREFLDGSSETRLAVGARQDGARSASPSPAGAPTSRRRDCSR